MKPSFSHRTATDRVRGPLPLPRVVLFVGLLISLGVGSGIPPLSGQWKYDVTLTGYPGAKWKALTSYIDKPALGDVTGDRVPEIFGVSVFGDVFCVDGLTGQILWTYEDDHSYELAIYICPALADLDCDGHLDVISVVPSGNVLALDGRTGRRLWVFKTDGQTGFSPTIFDTDRDGMPEVVVTDLSGNLYLISSAGRQLWKIATGSELYGTPAVGLLDDVATIFVGDRQGMTRSHDARSGARGLHSGTGAPVCTSPILIRRDPTDAFKLLLSGHDDGTVKLSDARTGAVRWSRRFGKVPMSDFALGDLNGDGLLEIAFSNAASRVIVASLADGSELWSRGLDVPLKGYRDTGRSRTKSSEVLAGQPMIVDADGDGRLDVVIETRGLNNYIYSLRGSNGDVIWSHGNRNLYRHPALSESVVISTRQDLSPLTAASGTVPSFSRPTPVVADFDLDGKLELLVNDRDEVGLISMPLGSAAVRGEWPKYMSSPCNNIARDSVPCIAEARLPELLLTVDPPVIRAGESTRLCWESKGAVAVEFSGLPVAAPPAGCRNESPSSDTTWTATARGCGGRSTATVSLRVQPAPPPLPPVTAAPPASAGLTDLGLQDVFFEYDWYRLTPEAVGTLDENIRRLAASPGTRVLLEASCDERGVPVYNRFLAIARAESVRNYLLSHGVAEGRIEVSALGETTKWDDRLNEEGWARNRRVHFVVIP